MATSKCGHCGAHDFELKTIMPTGAARVVEVVQCSACGAVMGTLQTGEIDQVFTLAGRIDAGLRAVVEALNRR
jgi:hypothetical protein